MTEKKQQTAYPLRMPTELREHLTESARDNNRSLNAEIIARLEESYFHHKQPPAQLYTEEAVLGLVRKAGDALIDQIRAKLMEGGASDKLVEILQEESAIGGNDDKSQTELKRLYRTRPDR